MNTYALNANWLADTGDITITDQYVGTTTTDTLYVGTCQVCNCTPCYCNHNHYWWGHPVYYPVYQQTPAEKIRLTIDEVNKLRAASRKDAKLKAILQKLTPAIEVGVVFAKEAA